MSELELDDFLYVFLEEAKESLNKWEELALSLDKEFNQEKCNDLFRQAHNLKGTAKMVGLEDIGEFLHKIEDLMGSLRDGKIAYSSELISLFLNSQSVLSEWLQNKEKNNTTIPKEKELLEQKIKEKFKNFNIHNSKEENVDCNIANNLPIELEKKGSVPLIVGKFDFSFKRKHLTTSIDNF